MTNRTYRSIHLARRPKGAPAPEDFRLESHEIPTPGPGQVLVKGLWLSLDPYMRGRMSAAASYADPVAIDAVMTGGVAGVVEESNHPGFPVGTQVQGQLGWAEYALANPAMLRKVDPGAGPLSLSVSLLGMPGMTAYFAFLATGRPEPGDTVVVSAASGAVGQIVCQLARLMACRVVGIAGGAEKCAYLRDEIGADAAIDYKTGGLDAALAAACPDGIDVYFDNVGGDVSQAVFAQLARDARIVVCGQISQYNLETPELGDRNLRFMLVKQAKMHGFLVSRHEEHFPRARKRLAQWRRDGRIRYREDVAEGLEAAPEAFIGMLDGRNFGKMVVKLA